MDFELSDELKMIRDNVRDFTERELIPLEHEFCITGSLPNSKRLELEQKGKDLGFWALDVPEKYGGAGMSELAMCVISEELYRCAIMFDFGGQIEPALYLTTDEQKKDYFYSVLEGRKHSCYAFTEPNTGSDLASIITHAEKEGEYWIINGSKTFISHVDRADFIMVFVSTEKTLGAKGITCFLVDKDVPGLHISKPILTMGDGWAPYTLSFDNVKIHENKILGELNQGFIVASEQLTHGRLRIAAFNVGIAARCLEMATAYSRERKTFGEPLANRQAIQWMLADSAVELQAARLLVWHAAYLHDRGEKIRTNAFMAKLYATEMAQRVTDRALQIFGGLGYCRELPIQSFFRQVRIWRIGHGASEINRLMIARDLLRG